MAIVIWSTVDVTPLARRIIDLAELFPNTDKPYVTSARRVGDNTSHHGGLLTWNGSPTIAVDFGDYGDPEPDDQDQLLMRDFAKWLDDNFRPYIAELIHSTPYNTDNGFYVKYGQRYEGFSQATKDAHINHVHVAFSQASVEQAISKASPTGQEVVVDVAVEAELKRLNSILIDENSNSVLQVLLSNYREEQLKSVNLLEQVLLAAPVEPTVHIVVEGDTLSSIAVQYGLTVDELVKINQLINVGQVLKVSE